MQPPVQCKAAATCTVQGSKVLNKHFGSDAGSFSRCTVPTAGDSTERNQEKSGLSPETPTCTSPGCGFGTPEVTKSTSAPQQEQHVVLIPRAQCRILVSFALPVTHRNFHPGWFHQPASLWNHPTNSCRSAGFMHSLNCL